MLSSKVRSVRQRSIFQFHPDFPCHFLFDGSPDKKNTWPEIDFQKPLSNAEQSRSCCLPMLVSPGRVNATFEFAESKILILRFVSCRGNVLRAAIEQTQVYVVLYRRHRQIVEQRSPLSAFLPT